MTNVIEINYVDYDDIDDNYNENNEIENIDDSLSYNDYFRLYLIKNKPCVIKSATESWTCRKKWLTDKEAPNFEYLKELFGSSSAPVADCSKKYYNSQMKTEMNINDYIDYWIATSLSKDKENKSSELLYLKDWHCVKEHKNLSIYKTPKYFASDWLNEYYSGNEEDLKDDYMFVYMGPKGTWTPFHSDVLSSYSWSANVVGKKLWYIYPPGEENRFKDKFGNLVYDVTSEEDLSDVVKYPNYYKAQESIDCYKILQRAGDIVFVPSGWHHQVINMDDTISINHNWMNGSNIEIVWKSLSNELLKVMKEIEDCRVDINEWNDKCQLILKASYGINYIEFYKILYYIGNKRISFINDNKNNPVISFNYWHLGKNHCIYDLNKIKIVLKYMINDVDKHSIESIIFPKNEAALFIDKINHVV